LRDPELDVARKAIDLILEAQWPYPAFAVDRHWMVAASHQALPELYAGVADGLLKQPINALRLSLHPEGLAPRISNLAEWRAHVLPRLRRQVDLTSDPVLADFLRELSADPVPGSPASDAPSAAREFAGVVFPLQIVVGGTALAFFTTITLFATPTDVTLSELAIESFFPAEVVRRLSR
jgi:hypothetical protein